MTLSRRSFLKGLAALPLVAAFLPKEVPALPEQKFKKFGTESSHFDGKYEYKSYGYRVLVHKNLVITAFTDQKLYIGDIVCFEEGGRVRRTSSVERERWGGIVVGVV
jgi:hypothetical protein